MKKTMKQRNGAGSAAGLWRVAADHGDRLRRYLLRRSDSQEVEDLIQEIYVRLLKATRDEFVRNPVAYIFTVARSVVSDFRNHAKRHRETICTDTDMMQQASEKPDCLPQDAIAASVVSKEFLLAVLNELPPEQQAALLMFERDGYSYAEIANKLNVSERQVERYLLKARERFAQALRSEQGEPGSSTSEKEDL